MNETQKKLVMQHILLLKNLENLEKELILEKILVAEYKNCNIYHNKITSKNTYGDDFYKHFMEEKKQSNCVFVVARLPYHTKKSLLVKQVFPSSGSIFHDGGKTLRLIEKHKEISWNEAKEFADNHGLKNCFHNFNLRFFGNKK